MLLFFLPTVIVGHPGSDITFIMGAETWPHLGSYECEGKKCFKYEPIEVLLKFSTLCKDQRIFIHPYYTVKTDIENKKHATFSHIKIVDGTTGINCSLQGITILRHKRNKDLMKNKTTIEIEKEIIFEKNNLNIPNESLVLKVWFDIYDKIHVTVE